MKLLFENWRQYLLTEQSEFLGHHMQPEEKLFISKEPYTEFRNVAQQTPQSFSKKPQGLWYSCGDDWVDWAKYEMPHWIEESNYLYEVVLGDDVLRITNADEFQWLEKNFLRSTGFGGAAMDWKAIQDAGYSGIEICPYQAQFSYSADWYYGWDVASGCIWDSRGIVEVKLLAQKPEEEIEARSVQAKEQERTKELVAFKEKVKKATEESGCGDWFYRSDYMQEDWESIDPYEMSEEEFMQKLADHVMDNCGFDVEKWY